MRVERARYLLAALETGSLRAAAAKCGISQPTLGQQIDLLEEELDVVLLTRSRSGVRPTPAAQAMIETLRGLVVAEDAVRESASELRGAYRGRVLIGTIPVVAEAVIATVVGRLRTRHPDLRFGITESNSTAIESSVAAGDLDFGVVTLPAEPPPSTIHRSELMHAPIGVVVRTDHMLASRRQVQWSDLETWPIVTMREGTVMWERLHQGIAQPDIVVQAASARSVQLMVAEGAGLGILAPFDTPNDPVRLRWIPIRDTSPVRIALVRRRDSRPSRSALIVRQLITDRASELLTSTVHLGGMSADADNRTSPPESESGW